MRNRGCLKGNSIRKIVWSHFSGWSRFELNLSWFWVMFGMINFAQRDWFEEIMDSFDYLRRGAGGGNQPPSNVECNSRCTRVQFEVFFLAVAAKHEYLAAVVFNSKYIGCVFCVILFLVVVTKTGLRYLFRRVCSEARIFLQ